jgi:hypothetical protein
MSNMWQELFKLFDTQLIMSSSYHPQTDDQTERLNQCLETYLRCAVHASSGKWFHWLPLAEFWYNTTYHTALGHSPFEVLYGHPPRHFGITDMNACSVPDLSEWLCNRQEFTSMLLLQLARAQQRMKAQADKHRSKREFQVGDLVYLKVRPYVQISIAPQSCQKLSFRFFDPYRILQRVGAMAYKLDLPVHARIHNVVHVSQLKKHVLSDTPVSSDISVIQLDNDLIPAGWLQHRLIRKGGTTSQRVLVCWKGLPPSLATWESYDEL